MTTPTHKAIRRYTNQEALACADRLNRSFPPSSLKDEAADHIRELVAALESELSQPAESALQALTEHAEQHGLYEKTAEAGLAEVVKDAERYRWLRDTHPADPGSIWVARGLPNIGLSNWRHEKLDAAIDAAIAQQAQKEGK